MKAAALLLAALIPAAEPEVSLPVRCGETTCILPKQVLADIVAAHNYHIEEIRRLEAACPAAKLPDLKKDRDS